ncbi:hypothetical protein ACHAXT_009203 [Thalassiosira profunda]
MSDPSDDSDGEGSRHSTMNNDGAAKPAAHPTKKKRKYTKQTKDRPSEDDHVQLFAFNSSADNAAPNNAWGDRPKRKLKAVSRFDAQTYDRSRAGPNNCRAGHGFPCPRCSYSCSYDSRSCEACGLAVYYEAGVGAVVLKERTEVGASALSKRRRREKKREEIGVSVEKPPAGKGKKRRGRPPKAVTEGAKPAAEGVPKRGRGRPPKKGRAKSAPPTFRGKAKRLPLRQHSVVDSSDSEEDEPAPTKASASPKLGGTRGVPRPVVAFYEKRPFAMKEYPRVESAKEDLSANYQTIREKRDYNLEHTVPKKRAKGRFMYYDFRDVSDTRTARRWQCNLLAVAHADFDGCESLVAAREHPSWPARLADAHHRMRMGRRILKFLRESVLGGAKRKARPGGWRVPALTVQHVSFASGVAFPPARRASPEDGTKSGDDEDEAAKNAIVEAIRGRANSSPLVRGRSPSASLASSLDVGSLGENSAALDSSIGTGIMEPNLGNVSESEEFSMVHHALNADFPPVDRPPGIGDVSTAAGDVGTKLQETERTLQSVSEENKELQSKYDTLLAKSTGTEKELRDEISTLMESSKPSGESEAASDNEGPDMETQLATITTERDDLSERVGGLQLERDQLAQQLERANAQLQAWERVGSASGQHAGEASTSIRALSIQLKTVSEEKTDLAKKYTTAASDLSEKQEELESQRVRISGLESSVEALTAQREEANSRVAKLTSANKNIAVLVSERKELQSSLDDSMRKVAHLEAEKVGRQAIVEELRARVEKLSSDLKQGAKHNVLEIDHRLYASREAKYMDTIDHLSGKVEEQSDDAHTLHGTIANLTAEVTKLQSERDEAMEERDAAQVRVRELQSGEDDPTGEITATLNSEKEVLMTKIEECIARLYSEKDDSSTDSPVFATLQGDPSSPVQKLKIQMRMKEHELSKLRKDKEKLEAYTKQTLSIFQQKYFATAQEYKVRLKEKEDRIRALEARKKDPPIPHQLNLPPVRHGGDIRRAASNDTKMTDEFGREISPASAHAEYVLRVPPSVVGWVIGKGGSTIRDMMHESETKIWVDQDSMGPNEPRVVYVSGKRSNVDVAVRMVKELVERAPVNNAPAQHGNRTWKKDDDDSAHRTRPRRQDDDEAPSTHRTRPRRQDDETSDEFGREISPAYAEYVLHVPPSVVGWVIGKGGSTIRDMMHESETKIWVDQDSMGPNEPRVVYVSGKRSNVDVAARMVRELVERAPANIAPAQHGNRTWKKDDETSSAQHGSRRPQRQDDEMASALHGSRPQRQDDETYGV